MYVAPTSPLNFTLETVPDEPTQLSASWSRPIPTHGIITAYTLYCTISTDQYYPEQWAPDSMGNNYQLGNVESDVLIGLVPLTNYECFVTANTSVGEGDPSSTETQRTDESGE